ncbi:hypothetical protein Ddc_10196 [Ditylenchus destructor]|nr:hypothetical protein Ddc_10196 [Ditylenchus destructor]
MFRDNHVSKLCLKAKIGFKKLVSYELDDSEDPEKPGNVIERLQSMEFLEKKLEDERNKWVFGVVLTVAIYFLCWYNTECWRLTFQESPCQQPGALSLFATNESTLAEDVDEFTLALRAPVAKFRDTIEMSYSFFNYTEMQLIRDKPQPLGALWRRAESEDMAAFRALKREWWKTPTGRSIFCIIP